MQSCFSASRVLSGGLPEPWLRVSRAPPAAGGTRLVRVAACLTAGAHRPAAAAAAQPGGGTAASDSTSVWCTKALSVAAGAGAADALSQNYHCAAGDGRCTIQLSGEGVCKALGPRMACRCAHAASAGSCRRPSAAGAQLAAQLLQRPDAARHNSIRVCAGAAATGRPAAASPAVAGLLCGPAARRRRGWLAAVDCSVHPGRQQIFELVVQLGAGGADLHVVPPLLIPHALQHRGAAAGRGREEQARVSRRARAASQGAWAWKLGRHTAGGYSRCILARHTSAASMAPPLHSAHSHRNANCHLHRGAPNLRVHGQAAGWHR